MSVVNPTSRRRFHDLDALRSLLMIWGIAVHTSTLGPTPVLDAVARVSGLIRMEAFFIVSGLLTAGVFQRHGAGSLLRKRLLALGVPLVFGLLLLNPLTNYLIYRYHNGPISLGSYFVGDTLPDPEGPMVWHLHLWFLFALLVYAVLTPVLAPALKRCGTAGAGLLARSPRAITFAALCAIVATCCLGSRVFFEALIEPYAPLPLHFLARSILYYLAFYACGVALFHAPALLQTFARPHLGHAAVAAALVITSNVLLFDVLPKLTAETVRLVSEAYLAVALSGTLFGLAQRFFSRESRVTTYFSEAAYSIYLLHFLVIYLVATALQSWLDGSAFMGVVMLATFGLTLAFHHYAVSRCDLLRLLLNGRWKRAQPAEVSPLLPARPAPTLFPSSHP